MEAGNEVMHGGTYNAHPVAMAAAKSTLETMRGEPELFDMLWRQGEELRQGLQYAVRDGRSRRRLSRSWSHTAAILHRWRRARSATIGRLCAMSTWTSSASSRAHLQDSGFYIHPDPLECFYMSTAHTDGGRRRHHRSRS